MRNSELRCASGSRQLSWSDGIVFAGFGELFPYRHDDGYMYGNGRFGKHGDVQLRSNGVRSVFAGRQQSDVGGAG